MVRGHTPDIKTKNPLFPLENKSAYGYSTPMKIKNSRKLVRAHQKKTQKKLF